MQGGFLDLELDPKTAWALQNRQNVPVDVIAASRDTLFRVPGSGTRVVARIIAARSNHHLGAEDLALTIAVLR
ncbi:hypothetical protein [Ensifer adhaerens]|uniref:hypothetical protein n=1 Tax=Ensifer adhaerens TaxID=106592 RepID=UPI000CF14622|nr:hypothetical protein [Ensifer adhaerens]